MALKLTIRFPPIFASPRDPNPTHHRPSTHLHYSLSDNADADSHNRRHSDAETSPPPLPRKNSRHLRNAQNDSSVDSHPAFRFSNIPKSRPKPVRGVPENVKIGDDGMSYVIEGAPFEFKYSYTETPKVKPIKIREAPFVPFGPVTMPRPWTGRAPLPPSKKKLKEFDSFVLPPPHKKGVKPVQSPGPFLPGTSPRYVRSREEILGEPLTQDEINDLVRGSMKATRQLNIGRDGLTHNMLDNIHAHWKRRRVCKIRCKGVCTVDMDNVCQQLEEKAGGKVIYRKGGVVYLFRGRNYNYKTRPRFPLMLWKPVPPVYPRLIQRVPEGLTLEEATDMRQKGRELTPICKLGKNGVYCDLVYNVREAFEECELVRINCQGLDKSDYRKIGAKLRDLVPCMLLSFENEHILMWRGQNWKSSFPNLGDDCQGANKNDVDNENYKTMPSADQEFSAQCLEMNSVEHASKPLHDNSNSSSSRHVTLDKVEAPCSMDNSNQSVFEATDAASHTRTYEAETTETSNQSASVVTDAASLARTYDAETTNCAEGSSGEPEPCCSTNPSISICDDNSSAECLSGAKSDGQGTEDRKNSKSCSDGVSSSISGPDMMVGASHNYVNGMVDPHADKLLDGSGATDVIQPSGSVVSCTKEIFSLLGQAVEGGSALLLDENSLDVDNIYQITVSFAKSAPPGPVFRKQRKFVVQKSDKQEEECTSETTETTTVSIKGKKEKNSKVKNSKIRRKDNFDEQFLNVVPQGTLGVDELAKLLT